MMSIATLRKPNVEPQKFAFNFLGDVEPFPERPASSKPLVDAPLNRQSARYPSEELKPFWRAFLQRQKSRPGASCGSDLHPRSPWREDEINGPRSALVFVNMPGADKAGDAGNGNVCEVIPLQLPFLGAVVGRQAAIELMLNSQRAVIRKAFFDVVIKSLFHSKNPYGYVAMYSTRHAGVKCRVPTYNDKITDCSYLVGTRENGGNCGSLAPVPTVPTYFILYIYKTHTQPPATVLPPKDREVGRNRERHPQTPQKSAVKAVPTQVGTGTIARWER